MMVFFYRDKRLLMIKNDYFSVNNVNPCISQS